MSINNGIVLTNLEIMCFVAEGLEKSYPGYAITAQKAKLLIEKSQEIADILNSPDQQDAQ